MSALQLFISSHIPKSQGCEKLGTYAMNGGFDPVSKVAQECIKKLNAALKGLVQYKIVPLHIAAIFGNLGAIKALCIAGANPNKEDHKGYTPFHFASMNPDPKVLESFQEYCPKDAEMKNIYAATAKQLTIYQRYFQQGLCFEGETCENSLAFDVIPPHITFDEACKPNGWVYVNEHVGNSTDLAHQWLDPESNALNLQDVIDSAPDMFLADWIKFKQNPPLLHVKPQEMLAQDGTSYTHCGVFAGEEINVGTFISEYKGRFVNSEDYSDGWYRVGTLDGKHYRDTGSIFNDGFPNSVALAIEKRGGNKNSLAIYSIENIKEGEEILWNYGPSYAGKVGSRVEIAESALLKVFL